MVHCSSILWFEVIKDFKESETLYASYTSELLQTGGVFYNYSNNMYPTSHTIKLVENTCKVSCASISTMKAFF